MRGSSSDGRPSRALTQDSISSLTGLVESDSPSTRTELETRISGRGFELVGLLSTVFVFLVTGGTATLILVWLSAFHDPVYAAGGLSAALRNGSFAIREPSGSDANISSDTHTDTLRILMFSALASHLVSVTSTILVTLMAYRAATQWLRASDDPDDANITPIQYGLLVRTLGSGSLMSIINTLRYTSRSKRANTPRFFKEALIGVTGIYILNHAVGLVDLWLHSGARSISVVRPVPIELDAQFGFTYYEERCGTFNKSGLPCQNLIAPYDGGIWWAPNMPWIYFEGYDTALDINPYKRVEYINNTAIIVPGSVASYKSQGFTFNTPGVQVQCKNLRDECDTIPAPAASSSGSLGADSNMVVNCSKAGYPGIPYYTTGEITPSGEDTRNIQSFVIGIIGDEMGGMIHGPPDFTSAWTPNPAEAVVQLRWLNNTPYQNVASPVGSNANAMDLYASCSMTFLDVLAQYDMIGDEWKIVETSLSSSELASVYWTPLIFQVPIADIQYALKPSVSTRGGEAIPNLELAMAKYTVTYATSLTKLAPASNFTTPQRFALGLYPTAPTLLLVGCLYVYSIIALVIFFLACRSNNRVISLPPHMRKEGDEKGERSALDVTQTWLTDPLPFIGSIFPGGDGRQVARSVESDPLRQVYDSDWELGKVGIGLYKGSKGEMVFGLMRQYPAQSRRYGRVFPVVNEEIALQERAPIPGSAVLVPSLAAKWNADS